MVKEGVGSIVRLGKGNTRYITVPADVAKDDRFPFEDKEKVRVVIDVENRRLIVEKIE